MSATIFDLPGTYSLNASSLDENIVIELLMNRKHADFPDVAVIVADIENIKRNLLLFTQIKDLGIPSILVVNMSDRMRRKGISLDVEKMEEELNTKIVLTSTLKKEGIQTLKNEIANYSQLEHSPCLDFRSIDPDYFASLQKTFPQAIHLQIMVGHYARCQFCQHRSKHYPIHLQMEITRDRFRVLKRLQQRETIKRYQFINEVLKKCLEINRKQATDFQSRLDRILTHRFWGYVIFFIVLFTIFQAIYDWSSYPMDAIDSAFVSMSEWAKTNLPSWFVPKLIAEGIIPGLGGVAIFIPQIAILFVFISILEETGYMSRVVFLMDRVLRRFGLSGKSVVPLISGTACAIPAIMATRNIENWKERLITILVTPFTTCSARLPVYLILIALVIPDTRFLGANMQGLVLMGLYLLGFGMALAAAYVLQLVLKLPHKTAFVVEMPNYRIPILRNVGITVYNKTKSFVLEAGKIILAISVLLWVLASNGPSSSFGQAEAIVGADQELTQAELEQKISAYKLEKSYLGQVGKFIEPAIAPLGYDWKIGIAIVSSFAAREVFVGTLATIYNVGTDEEDTIKNRMADEVHPDGKPVFTLASGMSLMIFYAFAMQCMSTLAIVRKETNSWKWPSIQLLVMTIIAYLAAFVTFQVL